MPPSREIKKSNNKSKEMICPICSSKNTKLQKAFRNNHSAFSNLNRVACNTCELHFAHPMPEIEKLDAYNDSYHDSANGGFIGI